MELTFECPHCKMIDHVDGVESVAEACCSHCRTARPLRPEAIDAEGGLAGCPLCGSPDVYIQKDFPQGLGLAIVCVGFAASTVFWYYENPIPAYMILLTSALLDMVLYYRVSNVAICYRCQSQFRGAGSNPEGRFSGFDLAIGERYRQERLRVEELRRRGAAVEPAPTGSSATDADR